MAEGTGMIRLRQLTMGGLLLGLGAVFVACGGDDTSGPAATGGSGGTAGSTGTGGKSGGTGGSATGGGGNATGGSAGKADGSAGTGGGEAGPDTTPDTVTPDTVTPDTTPDTVTPDTTPDVVVSDASDASDAPRETGPVGCPASEPTDGTDCTSNNLRCDYGPDGGGVMDAGDAGNANGCICHTISAGVLKWACTSVDGGTGPTCPKGAPPTPGDTCTDAGASMSCRFGSTWCFCNDTIDAAPNKWECL
jgi:hypothetical protein